MKIVFDNIEEREKATKIFDEIINMASIAILDDEEIKKAECAKAEVNRAEGARNLIKELATGKCRGVGGATVYKIEQFASELGML